MQCTEGRATELAEVLTRRVSDVSPRRLFSVLVKVLVAVRFAMSSIRQSALFNRNLFRQGLSPHLINVKRANLAILGDLRPCAKCTLSL